MNFEKPTAEMAAWREMVRANGSVLSKRVPVDIHHVIGRTAKVKGVGNIGHVFILPLCHVEHLWTDWGHEGLRLMKVAFLFGHGYDQVDVIEDLSMLEFQKFLFDKMCREVGPPCNEDVIEAILAWHR